jgi:hypothetical protein
MTVIITQADAKDPRAIAYHHDQDRLTKLQNELSRKEAELENANLRNYEMQLVQRADRLDAEASALIGEVDAGPKTVFANVEQLEHDIGVLTTAIEKQKAIADVSRGAYSVALCELNRKKYLEIETRMLKAVNELAQANEAEVKFFQELISAGAHSIVFRPMRNQSFGVASDPQSVASFHRREVEQFLPEIL